MYLRGNIERESHCLNIKRSMVAFQTAVVDFVVVVVLVVVRAHTTIVCVSIKLGGRARCPSAQPTRIFATVWEHQCRVEHARRCTECLATPRRVHESVY